MNPIRVIFEKEWADMIRNRLLLISMLIPAAVFLLIPFFISVFIPILQGGRVPSDPSTQKMLEILTRYSPELQGLDFAILFQIFTFRQFLLLLMLVPVMGALSIATFSIIGEKQNRSLEPLLATPITTGQLLVGKSFSAALPATVLTWAVFGLYALGIRLLSPSEVFTHVMNPVGLGIIFLICPLIAILGLSLGVVVSSRSNDPRTAQQVGLVVVLPLIALFVSQLRGLFQLKLQWVLVGAVGLAVIDFIILKIGVALFQRETILTRWK